MSAIQLSNSPEAQPLPQVKVVDASSSTGPHLGWAGLIQNEIQLRKLTVQRDHSRLLSYFLSASSLTYLHHRVLKTTVIGLPHLMEQTINTILKDSKLTLYRNERGRTKHITKAQAFQSVKTVKSRSPGYSNSTGLPNTPDPKNCRSYLQFRAKNNSIMQIDLGREKDLPLASRPMDAATKTTI